jgi:K+-sensing histidine kinase KdpD
MKIEDCILKTYPTVFPYEGINSIEKKLMEKNYLIVADDEQDFYGILIPSDILSRPHKLVIDCLTPKEVIRTDDTFVDIFGKFRKTPSEALPVFFEDRFIGIIEKNCALEKLKIKVDELYNESVVSQGVKTAFMHNLSHEIRTPLNQVLGFMSLLIELSQDELISKGEQYYSIIKKSSEQFLSIMNDLIELSLLHSGDQIQIYKDNVYPETILSDLKIYFDTDIKRIDPELEIYYYNPDVSLNIYSDGKKIKQILFHLIDAAIKHSSGKKIISYGYELNPEKSIIRFFVKNLAAKISDTQKTIILEAFEKSHSEQNPYNNGMGFGIDLVKELVEAIDGSIEMHVDEDCILTAYFSIPLIKL